MFALILPTSSRKGAFQLFVVWGGIHEKLNLVWWQKTLHTGLKNRTSPDNADTQYHIIRRPPLWEQEKGDSARYLWQQKLPAAFVQPTSVVIQTHKRGAADAREADVVSEEWGVSRLSPHTALSAGCLSRWQTRDAIESDCCNRVGFLCWPKLREGCFLTFPVRCVFSWKSGPLHWSPGTFSSARSRGAGVTLAKKWVLSK